jgi:hypothetical protein
MKSMFRSLLLLICLTLLTVGVGADAVRGTVVDILKISAQSEESSKATIEELVALVLGDDAAFFTGIEIELEIPEELMRFRNSFAVYLYRKIDPAPRTGSMIRYFGESLDYYVIPGTRKMYLQIPLRPGADLPGTPETTTIKQVTSVEDYPLLLTVLPIMKGIPSDVSRAEFSIRAYPYVADEGVLDLKVEAPGDQPYTLRIDGDLIPYRERGYLLSSGLHELSVESSSYLPQKRSISIPRGMRTPLTLTLEKREPRLNFETPDGTVIFLDGERVNSTSLKVEEGMHTVVFKLGDYSMTREFEVSGGKSYTVTLFFDVFVKEN